MSPACSLCTYHLKDLSDSEKKANVRPGASGCQHSPLQPCNLSCRLAAGERRIQDAKAALFQAIEDQCQLRSEFNQRNDPLLSRLPVEVVCRIFQFCIPPSLTLADFREQLTANSTVDFTSPKSLLQLGAVCRGWRQVAWSCPQLWCDIFITTTPKSSPSRITFIEEWIRRSGELPLNICLHLGCYNNISLINSLIDTLGSVAHRWAIYYAYLSAYPEYGEQLAMHFKRATKLQGLALNTTNLMKHDAWSVGNVGGDDLKFLFLKSGRQVRGVTSCRNLTHFVGEHLTTTECIEILRNAPQVLDCTIRSVIDSGHPTLLVHSVKTFHLRGETHILQSLKLPSLKELALCGLKQTESFPLAILPFIVCSGCQLEALTIHNQTDIIDDYSELFRLNPSLKRLELRPHYDCEWAFSRLGELLSTSDNSSDQALPNLQSLTYLWTELPKIPWKSINAMVQTTASPDVVGRPLTDIHFVMRMYEKQEEYLHEDDLERIQELAGRGIKLRVSGRIPPIDVVQACKDRQGSL